MEKKKVLIVDDDEQFLKITKLNLEETERYEAMTLPNGKDVISCVHTFRPNIILLDILMPEIGGIAVCEILNNDPIGSKVPIIIVSALDKYEEIRKAYKVGVVGYISKPAGKNDIVAEIEKVLVQREES